MNRLPAVLKAVSAFCRLYISLWLIGVGIAALVAEGSGTLVSLFYGKKTTKQGYFAWFGV